MSQRITLYSKPSDASPRAAMNKVQEEDRITGWISDLLKEWTDNGIIESGNDYVIVWVDLTRPGLDGVYSFRAEPSGVTLR